MSVFIIAFRDFIEAFFLISLLLGFSKKQNLNKENAILTGGLLGVCTSIAVAIVAFYILPLVKISFPIDIVDAFGHFSIILSGLMILYITYKLHPFFTNNKNIHISNLIANQNTSYITFFIFTFLLVLQEGFEIVIFGITTSFFKSSATNIFSLFLGFLSAVGVGVIFYKTYLKNHIKKLFKITEFIFIIYGVLLILHGILELSEQFFS